MLDKPVLFLIFNRPEPTARVFDRIRQAKPKRLFVAADGPRKTKSGEERKCEQAREIVSIVDWDCELRTLFRDQNLGCGKAVSSAIDWFFSEVEEGIIVEDDCLPRETFFSFCDQMLEYHRNDERVMHIGGSNYQNGVVRGNGSYYFSRFSHIWGWATWRNKWKEAYDFSLKKYEDTPLDSVSKELRVFLNLAKKNCTTTTWDVQWFIAVLLSEGMAVTPNVNLVENIGYGTDATHTRRVPKWFRKMCYGEIYDIKHPFPKIIDEAADEFVCSTVFRVNPIMDRIKPVLKRLLAIHS